MRLGWPSRFAIACLSLMACLRCADNAAATVWVDWVGGSPLNGNANAMTVTVTGPLNPVPLLGAAGEPNYWALFPATYTPPGGTPPLTSDMVRMTGGPGTGTYTIAFSQPVTNPILAIASLGGMVSASFDFGVQPFMLLTQGPGAWGTGTPFVVAGNVVTGKESNGVIQLLGTMNQITFTLPVAETWFGFTVGMADEGVPVTPNGVVVGAELSWEYADAEVLDPLTQLPVLAIADGFHLWIGSNARCDDSMPLTILAGDISVTVRTYADHLIAGITGTVCYELTAYNQAGDSVHSARVTVPVESVLPAPPIGLTVTPLL